MLCRNLEEIVISKWVSFHTNYMQKYKIFVNFNQTIRVFMFFCLIFNGIIHLLFPHNLHGEFLTV